MLQVRCSISLLKGKPNEKSSFADRLKLHEEGVGKSYTKTMRTAKRKQKNKKRQTGKLPGNSAAAGDKNSQEPRTSRFRGPAVQPDPPKDPNPWTGSDSDEVWYPVKQAINGEGRDHRHASRSRLITQKIRRPKTKARSLFVNQAKQLYSLKF